MNFSVITRDGDLPGPGNLQRNARIASSEVERRPQDTYEGEDDDGVSCPRSRAGAAAGWVCATGRPLLVAVALQLGEFDFVVIAHHLAVATSRQL